MGRCASQGETAALNTGQSLADGIDFYNVSTAGKQLTGHILQNGAGNQRLFKQSAAAAGEQE